MESVRKKITWEKEDVELLKILSNSITDTVLKTEAQKEVERLARMQELLLKIAQTYINLPTHQADSTLTRSLREIALFVGADRSYIFEYDLYENVTHNTHEWCAEGVVPQIDHLQNVPLGEISEWVNAHRNGEPFMITDIAQLPYDGPSSLRGILEPQNVKSLITVPITDNSELKGFVGFDSVRSTRVYSKKEQSLLFFFAQMIMNLRKRFYYEQMLENARIHAENSNRAKSELIRDISSRIKTPLSSVLGFANILDDSSLNVSQKKFIKEANLSAKSILEIINQIVDFSKAENGKLIIKETKTDMVRLASDVLELTKKEIDDKKIELLLDSSPKMPRFCHTDGTRLRQVLMNILDNAVKFTEKGEVALKIKSDRKSDGATVYTFEISDTGCGIPVKEQKRILNTFDRFSTNYATQFGGTGLGLVISYHIIKKMGGSLTFKSKAGKGSLFSFSIKAKTYDTNEALDPSGLSVSRMLLIEDNGNNREILEKYLRSWNIDVISCDNGIEAIRITRISEPFDVILIDYKMPVINGIDTIRLMREDSSFPRYDTHVIVMTGTQESSLIDDQAKQTGSLYKISKPIKITELYNTLYNISQLKKR
jgi:signal transduction histidine kinase/CheY-like chemotaxis protein